jgi:tRNA A37 methylthiotransferase MiaB
MVRKSGLAKRYLSSPSEKRELVGVTQKGFPHSETPPSLPLSREGWLQYKRKNAEKITLLRDANSLMNYDDELFLRSPLIDFTFRIEEVSYLTKILSMITGEDIGNDAKFNEYLQVKQLQENPASANIIIQTGCDNFCTFCIVPHTRGREVSRPQEDIVAEIRDVVVTWAKEVTLLGQNVNSYGKETRAKLWDEAEMKWIQETPFVKGGRGDFSHVTHIPYRSDLQEKARELRKNMTWPEKQIWYQLLSSDRLWGFRFLRQKPLLDFIVDFYCDELALVIEIDGESHVGNEEYDTQRTKDLSEYKITVLRFTNDEVLKNLEWVYEKIQEQIKILRPSGTSFTKEASKTPFRELLEKINQVDWLDRIRFTSSNPHDMTRDILDAHFDLPQMCPYLHFALQSGSDTMLKRMNRKHTYADFKSQLDYLRSRDPLFSISTDIIVGFPWETEEEFQATATAMRECQFDFAFIARYSPRSGTIATDKYEDDISPAEKARRWNILNDILRESVFARNALMIGREEEILISWEGKDETWTGRTRNWKEVLIPKFPLDKGGEGDFVSIKVGDLVKVKITESDGWVLKGERI